jgi:hypothetical protein
MLVPEFALRRWIEPSSADARVGRIEQGQRPNAVGMTTSQGLGDGGPDVVAPHHHPGDPQPIEEGDQVLRQDLRCVRLRRQVGLVRFAEPSEVRRDHVGEAGERPEDATPVVPEARPAVEQQQRVAPAETDVVEHDLA